MKKLFTLLFLFALSANLQAQENYLGEIRMFAGNFAPRGWAKCEGQLLSIAENTALFSLLGTTYGGNGINTFALPDLRGRFAMHYGQGPGLPIYSHGEMGGTATNTLTVSQLPAHSHAVNAVTQDGNSATPAGNYLAGTKLLDPEYANTGTSTNMNSGMISATGGSQSVNNMPPYNTVTFIIALEGIYPPRN